MQQSYKEYKTFHNINTLNRALKEDFMKGIDWKIEAIDWQDVEVESDDGTFRTYHNPVFVMSTAHNWPNLDEE